MGRADGLRLFLRDGTAESYDGTAGSRDAVLGDELSLYSSSLAPLSSP